MIPSLIEYIRDFVVGSPPPPKPTAPSFLQRQFEADPILKADEGINMLDKISKIIGESLTQDGKFVTEVEKKKDENKENEENKDGKKNKKKDKKKEKEEASYKDDKKYSPIEFERKRTISELNAYGKQHPEAKQFTDLLVRKLKSLSGKNGKEHAQVYKDLKSTCKSMQEAIAYKRGTPGLR